MPLHLPDCLLVLVLTALIFGLLVKRPVFHDRPALPKAPRRSGPRRLRPHTPDDCVLCRTDAITPTPAAVQSLIPYCQTKTSRGRKKSISTAGLACRYEGCRYFNNADPAVHALVGYGHHGRHDPIQDFYCQACHPYGSFRRAGTPRSTASKHLQPASPKSCMPWPKA